MTIKSHIFLLLVLLLSQSVSAQGNGEARGSDSPVLRQAAKAEELYRGGHWERAHFIFVNDLAAIGDKYAQYMAGYMYLNGQGVPSDRVRASAWYRLAAENGGPEYVAVRDELLESLDDSELESSDQIYRSLRRTYSDLVIVLDILRKERDALDVRPTGSRLSSSTSPVRIVDPRTGMTISRSEYERRIRSRMQLRLNHVTRTIGVEPVDADISNRQFEALADQVMEYLEVIDDR